MTIAPGAPIEADDIAALSVRHGVKLRKATQAVTTATQTDIAWDTEDEDTDGYHSGSSATVTIPTGLGGLYTITYGAIINGLNAAGRAFGGIVVTSSVTGGYLDAYRDRTDQVEDRFTVSFTGPLLAGDSFTCNVLYTEGTARTVTSYMTCYRVGA